MVRILVILGGLGKEGITNSVLTYLEKIDKEGITLHLGIAGNAEPDGLKRANAIGIPIHMLPGRNTDPVKYYLALKKLVKREHFDIVHVHGNSATLGIDMAGQSWRLSRQNRPQQKYLLHTSGNGQTDASRILCKLYRRVRLRRGSRTMAFSAKTLYRNSKRQRHKPFPLS